MDSIVTARVPSGIKEQGRIALQKIGATPTDLVNAAYRYVLSKGELPESGDTLFQKNKTPRILTKEQKQELKNQIRKTTFSIPSSFWDGHSDQELLEQGLKEKYARID